MSKWCALYALAFCVTFTVGLTYFERNVSVIAPHPTQPTCFETRIA